MGQNGELSIDLKLSRLVSDSASEITKLDTLDSTYRPSDLALIEQIYAAVEPCDLISK